MKTNHFYSLLLLFLLSGLSLSALEKKPNILFITLDDMNFDSINSYGSKIPNISPHIDSLVEQGIKFDKAYVQSPNCSPSRSVFQTGRYPHSNGMTGFFFVHADYKTLPEILKENGYYTAVINKPRDTSLTEDYEKYWDHNTIIKGAEKRGAITYEKGMQEFYRKIEKQSKPFYCVVNIADPHKPFFNDMKSKQLGYDAFPPSHIYKPEQVKIPPFLPKHPEIRAEVCNYYNSVKRADDCVGAILKTLKESSYEGNTIVIFLSDHGMPLPFAKSSLYPNGVKTPWIMKWPGKIQPKTSNKNQLISAVDFMPTILDLLQIPAPQGLEGKSFAPLIFQKPSSGHDYVFAEFNENASGNIFPMRAVHSKKYTYVFNAWATGKHQFLSASSSGKSHKIMKKMAETNPAVKKRFKHLLYRSVEELYDIEKDPHCLNNLIDSPQHQAIKLKLQNKLEQWMISTKDSILLSAYQLKDDLEKLNEFMAREDQKALARAQTLQWKRYKNRNGGTGKNTLLFKTSVQ